MNSRECPTLYYESKIAKFWYPNDPENFKNLAKKVSIQFPVNILENVLLYFLRYSMIMVCETLDYNMLKQGHQNFNLARDIYAAPIFSKFVTKVGLRMRRHMFFFFFFFFFFLQLILYSLGTNKIMRMT